MKRCDFILLHFDSTLKVFLAENNFASKETCCERRYRIHHLIPASIYISLIKGCGSSVLDLHTQPSLNNGLHVPNEFFLH